MRPRCHRRGPCRANGTWLALALAGLLGCGPATSRDPATAGGNGAAGNAATGAAATTGAGPAATGGPTASGPSAADFSLRTLDGATVRLSDYRGKKVVLIDFWSTSCHPCLQEMPELVKLYHELEGRGLVVLAIATDGPDTRAQVSAEVRSKKMDFPVLLDDDSSVFDRYNPKGELPFAVLVDRRGSVVLKRASYQAGDEESMRSLRAAIERALAAP